MANLLRTASAWLATSQREHCADDVVYWRGASSATVPATPGRSEFEVTDPDGMSVRVETRDFIIAIADLVLDGEEVEPAAGDRIIDESEADPLVYEVMAPASSLPAWRHADEYHNRYRIHTKFIGRQSSLP